MRTDSLPELCDKLGLHLLMNSEDMRYHFKYVDVINGTAQTYLEDGNGFIEYAKYNIYFVIKFQIYRFA
jgi:hypothetical protein